MNCLRATGKGPPGDGAKLSKSWMKSISPCPWLAGKFVITCDKKFSSQVAPSLLWVPRCSKHVSMTELQWLKLRSLYVRDICSIVTTAFIAKLTAWLECWHCESAHHFGSEICVEWNFFHSSSQNFDSSNTLVYDMNAKLMTFPSAYCHSKC